MTRTDTPQSADERFAVALGEYQSALELGFPVDRSAFLARFVDLPGLGADLDALDTLHRAGDEPPGAAAAVGPFLADFELVREVGRGGMGVVFEARQRSLGRVVAVKVLTHAAALDERARRRFLHEARAAALVDHPNVVPVYAVGDEGGVPFYVMPLVPAPSLADVIRDLRANVPGPLPVADTPEYFAAVARLGATAARALEAAHEQGVVHRDVKPANLLLDGDGKVWVTDFGLALAPFADALTRTGARPGTPRYMSPEQIAGPRDRLDARTDIYSLGATLYELVTRCPAFAAGEEPELLRLIVQTDPAAPHRVNPAVPFDLETVIRKAMARDPAERYSSARELAADLTRFVEGRPVLAQRAGLIQSFRKWARRNRRPVGAVGGTLLLGLVVGLSASAAVSRRAYEAERVARAEADENRRLAIAAVSELGRAADDIMAHAPGMEERELTVLLKCRDTLEPFAHDSSLPITLRREIAWVHYRLAGSYYRLGRYPESEASARTLVERLAALAALAPDDPALQKELAFAHRHVGLCLSFRGDRPGALDSFRGAREHATAAHRLQPDAPTAIVLYHELRCHVADYEADLQGDPGHGIATRREAIRAFEGLRDRYPTDHPLSYMRLASQWGAMGSTTELCKRLDEADAAFAKAVGYDEHLTKHFAKEPGDIHEFSVHYRVGLGSLRVRRGNLAGGLPELRRGVAELEAYVAKYTVARGHRAHLAVASYALAHAEAQAGNAKAAESAARRCVELLADPNLPCNAEFRARALAFLPDHRDPAAAKLVLDRPGPAIAPWVRAAVLYRAGQFAAAEAAADGSIAGEFVRAGCLGRRGEHAAAKIALDAASKRLAAEPLREPELLILQREIAKSVRD